MGLNLSGYIANRDIMKAEVDIEGDRFQVSLESETKEESENIYAILSKRPSTLVGDGIENGRVWGLFDIPINLR
jgi:hypothetical protein